MAVAHLEEEHAQRANGKRWSRTDVKGEMPAGEFPQGTSIALIPGGVEGIHLFAVDQYGVVRTDFFTGTDWVGWNVVC
jgi:hypothetical protein